MVKRTCICCGKTYEYCPNCQRDVKPLWMVSFHNETCKELFNLVSAYKMGMVEKDRVIQFVRDKGLNTSRYPEDIRRVIEDTGYGFKN